VSSYLVPDSGNPHLPDGKSFQAVASSSLSVPISVIEADAATRGRLQMQLGEQVHGFGSVDEFDGSYPGGNMIVILGPTCGAAPGLGGAEALINRRPELGAVLIANELTTELFQRALRTGVRDVLAAPVDTAQLQEAVRRVAESLGSVSRTAVPTGGVDGGDGEPGRVITVFSSKGGAGKSMVASNLGVLLAQRSERPVVLIDADLQFGDIAVMLKLAPQHTIVDAVNSIDRLDAGMLQNLLVTHSASGLRVLAAPFEPGVAEQITSAHVHKIVEALRSFCAFVVVDTPSYFNEVVLGLLEQCDDLVLVAGMDIPNIKNMKIGLQTMRLLDIQMSKIHLILNRANSKVKLDIGEVERTLQVKADTLVPSDVVVPQSVNKGAPVVLDAPKSGVAKAFEQLTDSFLKVEEKKKRR
jgi:pilus assembly protein CpaE